MIRHRHEPNATPAIGADPTTGTGPAGWSAPPIPADIPAEDAQRFAAAWLALTGSRVPIVDVLAVEDVPAAEWSPYFYALNADGVARQLTPGFPTRRSFTAMNPTTSTVNVWLARSGSILQSALQLATLGTQPIEGIMLLAPGSTVVFTHRKPVYAGVRVADVGPGLVTGWYEGSARSRQVPWEPVHGDRPPS